MDDDRYLKGSDIKTSIRVFQTGIKRAIDLVQLVHVATGVPMPDDIHVRLARAVERGDLLIRKDGLIKFSKRSKK